MQIRTKLTLQFTLSVSGMLILSFVTLFILVKQHTVDDFQNRLKEKAITSAILLLKVEQVDSTLLKAIDLSKKDFLHRENISIFDDQNKEVYTSNDTILFDAPSPLLEKIRRIGEVRFTKNEFEVVGIPFKDRSKQYIILAEAVDKDGRWRLKDLKKLLYTIIFVMIGLGAAAGWFYAGRALKPLKKVMGEVQSISTIDLSQRLAENINPDEIGKLVVIFNHLLSRIENAFNLQKTFVTNVSHELKNPLTTITSQLEVTLLKDRPSAEYREIIHSVLGDIQELNQLSNSLLDLASLSQRNINIPTSPVRIDEILWEVRESVQAINLNYKVDIHTLTMPADEQDLYLEANSYLIKTALQNLIENACKFSDDKRATVSLICSKGELEIRIFDNGPGIDKKELEYIFQPFYRSNNTSKVKGHGIGLSLSQRIIDLHKGVVEIDSTLGHGTQVTVFFFTKN